jgi:hypothetical protein
LVRIPACHAGGRGFESRPLRQKMNGLQQKCRNPFFFACLFVATSLEMALFHV